MTEENKPAIPNYQGNSHTARVEDGKQAPRKPRSTRGVSSEPEVRPKLERVTTSAPVERKKSRFAEAFTGDDMRTVGGYILFEVFFPAAKNMLSDAVSQGVERMLFGEGRGRPSSISSRSSSYIPYNRTSGTAVRRDEPRAISRHAHTNHDFREVILADRAEAEEVLDKLQALVDQYDVAVVSDLYELVGITGDFTDNKWGWTDLRSAKIRHIREGYWVDLPKTEPIS